MLPLLVWLAVPSMGVPPRVLLPALDELVVGWLVGVLPAWVVRVVAGEGTLRGLGWCGVETWAPCLGVECEDGRELGVGVDIVALGERGLCDTI